MPETTPPRAAWDNLAALYDRQLWLERRPLRAALALAAPAREDALIDLATGTGALLRALAAAPPAGRPALAVGVDASPAMLARVPALPGGWRVARADLARLPFPDAAFDVATAAYVLHVLDAGARAAALSEAYRVLRPGGRLVALAPVVPPHGRGRGLARALDLLARARPARLGGLAALDPRGELERAGLRPVRGRLVRAGYPSLAVLALRP